MLVQSRATGRFLVPSCDDGTPEWVASLREAGGGVVFDEEAAMQLLEDHCEPDDAACVVDLDRLGTSDDYADGPLTAAGTLRSGVPAVGGGSSALPDGNHGENIR